ncbi:MAG: hypothetical protein ACOC44_20440 [Promethearchaeia archaeon]
MEQKKKPFWYRKIKKAYNKGKYERRGEEVNISVQKNLQVVL